MIVFRSGSIAIGWHGNTFDVYRHGVQIDQFFVNDVRDKEDATDLANEWCRTRFFELNGF